MDDTPRKSESFDLEREIALLTESWCVEHNIPIKRRFTHEELEEAIKQVRQAMEDQKPVELHTPYPWCHGSPTKADCAARGYCNRNPSCGD